MVQAWYKHGTNVYYYSLKPWHKEEKNFLLVSLQQNSAKKHPSQIL